MRGTSILSGQPAKSQPAELEGAFDAIVIAYGRSMVEDLVTALIDALDRADTDPDLELDDEGEDGDTGIADWGGLDDVMAHEHAYWLRDREQARADPQGEAHALIQKARALRRA